MTLGRYTLHAKPIGVLHLPLLRLRPRSKNHTRSLHHPPSLDVLPGNLHLWALQSQLLAQLHKMVKRTS